VPFSFAGSPSDILFPNAPAAFGEMQVPAGIPGAPAGPPQGFQPQMLPVEQTQRQEALRRIQAFYDPEQREALTAGLLRLQALRLLQTQRTPFLSPGTSP
jgi:hypothetical protein